MLSVIKESNIDELYNLAAQTHVGKSFDASILTYQINIIGLETLLSSLKKLDMHSKVKILHVSSGEIFGKAETKEL